MSHDSRRFDLAHVIAKLNITSEDLAEMDFVTFQRLARIERSYVPGSAKEDFDKARRSARRRVRKRASTGAVVEVNVVEKSRLPGPEKRTRAPVVNRVSAVELLISLAEKSSGFSGDDDNLDDLAAAVGHDLPNYIAGLVAMALNATPTESAEIFAPLIRIHDMTHAYLIAGVSKHVMANKASTVIRQAANLTKKYQKFED